MKILIALLFLMSTAATADIYTISGNQNDTLNHNKTWKVCRDYLKMASPTGRKNEQFDRMAWEPTRIINGYLFPENTPVVTSKGFTWEAAEFHDFFTTDQVNLSKTWSMGVRFPYSTQFYQPEPAMTATLDNQKKLIYGVCFLTKAQTTGVELEVELSDGQIVTWPNGGAKLLDYPKTALGFISTDGFRSFTIRPKMKRTSTGQLVKWNYYWKVDKVFSLSTKTVPYLPYINVQGEPHDDDDPDPS